MPRINFVILAGYLCPSPMRRALNEPTLCLPLLGDETLFDVWVATIDRCDGECSIRVVVKDLDDAARLDAGTSIDRRRLEELDVVEELVAWRGSAGVLRDATSDLDVDERVVAIESSCLPPRGIGKVVEALRGGAEAVIAAGDREEPCGVYGFRRGLLQQANEIGYCDLKEQFLPRLNDRGVNVRRIDLPGPVISIRDARSYLRAIPVAVERFSDGRDRRISDEATVDPAAQIHGDVLVQRGATVGPGAVLHDSIVLRDASVGSGAVLSRTVVGPEGRVPAGARVVDRVVAAREAINERQLTAMER